MKQSISTTTIFKVMLIFTFIFAGFLAIAITYNKAFKVKNEMISILEKYEGYSQTSIGIINNYLQKSGYDTQGNCDEDEYGVARLDSNFAEKVQKGKKYYYCLNYFCGDGLNNKNKSKVCKINFSNDIPNGNQIYYNVKIFFRFNLPFLGEISVFNITGETKAIKLYSDSQKL